MAVIEKRKDALFPNTPCAQVLKKSNDEESMNKTEESTDTEEAQTRRSGNSVEPLCDIVDRHSHVQLSFLNVPFPGC